MLAAGSQLGPYEVVSFIGAGGMGEVYRAVDTRLDRQVAIKVLPSHLLGSADLTERFEREARAVAALSHPNVVALFDFGSAEGVVYAVTELLEGETLRELLASGPVPVRKAAELAAQIARGLAAAHDAGIVHRDLKPGNLFVARGGLVKILDFGLARQKSGPGFAEDSRTPAAAYPTAPGTVLGTVGYMSPEQVRGKTVDHRSDIFSFGCVLYEMLSGRQAFAEASSAETMTAILREEPPDLPPQVPPALDRVVRHCLEKDPEDRFQSAHDLAFDLESLSTASATVEVVPAAAESRAPIWRWLLLGTMAAGAIVAVFLAGRLSSPAQDLRFERVSFGRGTVYTARFAPDGRSIVYDAAWEGRPSRIFLKRPEGPEAAPLGPERAVLLSVSSSGELAVNLEPRLTYQLQAGPWSGTLARMPIDGSLPREVLQGVSGADWAPGGAELAIVREVGARCSLEYPPGHVLYETTGWLSSPRFSPDGTLIAVSEHPGQHYSLGVVVVVDRSGRSRRFESTSCANMSGLVWSPDGEEIWCGSLGTARAVTLSGRARVVATLPGRVVIHDISADGRVLLSHGEVRAGISASRPGGDRSRDLSWLGWSMAMDLSPDGGSLLFYEGLWVHPGVEAPDVIAMRGLDGSPVKRLAEGFNAAFSPDGRWIAAPGQGRVVLHPVGPGEARALEGGTFERVGAIAWMPRGDRVVFAGREPEKGHRIYLQEIDGGPPRALGPEQSHIGLFLAPSPDGTQIAAQCSGGQTLLYPVSGEEVRPFPSLELGDIPIRWNADASSFYFYRVRRDPVYEVFRLDLSSGEKELLRELAPEDPAGVLADGGVLATADASTFAFTYLRVLDALYVAEEMR